MFGLATRHASKWSEWGSPPGQGGAPKAETIEFEIRTLSGWGARYTAKKARRLGHGFCVLGSRIFPEVWVADFAYRCCEKKPDCCLAFWLKGVEQRRAGARRQGCSGTWFRTT